MKGHLTTPLLFLTVLITLTSGNGQMFNKEISGKVTTDMRVVKVLRDADLSVLFDEGITNTHYIFQHTTYTRYK